MQDRIEAVFNIRDHNYKFAIETRTSKSFIVELLDEDTWERWSSEINTQILKEMSKKVGTEKRISVFWRMMQTAIEGTSNEISFDVLSTADVNSLKTKLNPNHKSTTKEDKRYIILTQTTEFEKISFPLSLNQNPLTSSEYGEIIKNLRHENAQLRSQTGQEQIQFLQAELNELNQAYVMLENEKNAEINELKTIIQRLQNELQYSSRTKPQPQTKPRPPRAGSVTSASSRNSSVSRGSTRSKGSMNSQGSIHSRGSSPGRSSFQQRQYRDMRRSPATIEYETDEKLRKLKRYVAQKYRQ